jgi:hypothetical protein
VAEELRHAVAPDHAAALKSRLFFDLESGVAAPIAIGSDYYFGTHGGVLYADTFDPTIEMDTPPDRLIVHWRAHLDAPISQSMALSASGIIYQPVADGTLRAYAPNGTALSSLNLGLGLCALAAP